MESESARSREYRAAIPALIVVVAIIVAVATMSYFPHELGYFVGVATAVGLYVRASKRDPGSEGVDLRRLVAINLALIVVLLIVNYLYGVSNRPIGTVHSVEASIDKHVPIVPPFVVSYLGVYPYVVFTLAFLGVSAMHRQLRTLLAALIFSTLIGLLTFVIFQTYVRPPNHFGIEPFRSMMLYVEHTLYDDKFYSAFPSLHCAYATALGIAWARLRRPVLSPLLVIFSVTIVLSTQFLHQHFVMDLIYGVVLAIAAYGVAWWLSEWRALNRAGGRAPETLRT